MAKSGDISDLSGNLAKMYVSAPNRTQCCFCCFDIGFSKDALICCCTRHWYCSPQCREQFKDRDCLPNVIYPSCSSIRSFHSLILRLYDIKALTMVTEYIRSKEGVSRIDIKKLAESGDWKAALVLGLTYELRFVCESEECELAIRPPFEKSPPFSNSKAIKYYNMAAKQNSLEAFAALGRCLGLLGQIDHRGMKDYFMLSSNRFEASQSFLNQLCFSQLQASLVEIKEKYKPGDKLVARFPAVAGLIIFRLNFLDSKSSILRESFLIEHVSKVCSFLKKCYPKPRILCVGVQIFDDLPPRSVQNIFFVQKADDLCGKDNPVVRIDPGVRMDTKAVFDPGYFQRLHRDQPFYVCEHYLTSAGNTCSLCAQLARERILSVYENSFLFSRDETNIGCFFSALFSQESGLKKQDYFMHYAKYEVITVIRVMALQPMDLHPLQLAKDPYIYWPIIHYYGSVYSALKDILDVKIVDSIYKNIPEFTPLPERRNIVEEEKYVIKCGYCPCVHLDWKFEFKLCSRCKLRRYCSSSCQKLDWKLHKKECFLRPVMMNENVDEENGNI